MRRSRRGLRYLLGAGWVRKQEYIVGVVRGERRTAETDVDVVGVDDFCGNSLCTFHRRLKDRSAHQDEINSSPSYSFRFRFLCPRRFRISAFFAFADLRSPPGPIDSINHYPPANQHQHPRKHQRAQIVILSHFYGVVRCYLAKQIVRDGKANVQKTHDFLT